MNNPTFSANSQHVILGTGPLGRSVMNALLAHGQTQIRMVNRRGKADVPPGIELHAADITNPAQALDAVRGATHVYFCLNAPYTQWAEMFPPLQAGALQAATKVGARFIIGENVYMYGDTDGRPLTESTPAAAATKKGRVRAQMSAEIAAAHAAGVIKAVMVRASDYYGPYVTDSLFGDRVFGPLLTGKAAQLVGKIDAPHSLTFIDDAGRAMATLAGHDDAYGQIWHAPNLRGTTQRSMVEIAFRQAGLPPKINAMGTLMMRIGGLFIPPAREVIELMYEFNKPFIVDSSKIEKAYGLQPTPAEEGIAKTLAWYRQHFVSEKAAQVG